jgi:DNA-binding IclR family transcriptional regulator
MERGGKLSCGIRWIAQSCPFSKSEVARSLVRLERLGYVQSSETGQGKRGTYRLTHEIFQQVRGETEEPASITAAPLVVCPECHIVAKRVAKKTG